MSSTVNNETTLNLSLNLEVRALVEQAATQVGQTANDFALTTLVEAARNILEKNHVTELSDRDRDLFCALLDNADAQPNAALSNAAQRYKNDIG